MPPVLLTTAYWPNLHYFYYVVNYGKVIIEADENYQKQSYRNRMQILSANGILDLTIPVLKKNAKEKINSVEISYAEPWINKHWRAISSAYKNSPYFEFFEEDIKTLYDSKPQFLFEFNKVQLNLILKMLQLKKEIEITTEYKSVIEGVVDLREVIHPKVNILSDPKPAEILNTPYYQTFEDKIDFKANLSILDLLFNKGLQTIEYLKIK